MEAVWDSLPAEAREELDRAVLGVCEDPYGPTEPHSQDEPYRRVLTLRHTAVALLVMDAPPVRRVYIRHIDPLD
ncbi:hypothetical protein ACG5V6_21475 [Streptomyces chitinivorans]|uniref:Cytotoxic translational repressor of toxin-antitoxin stability system n=1 Tax=Streptomyces chitinivorans TaxID=1257027 RepID=A0ABW7HXY4_9ACTN|nr:hypothetical protein [Streptomyces chitinivorans]MDH2410219.1 hypothetical protein [Streptomyces chitinivorans]